MISSKKETNRLPERFSFCRSQIVGGFSECSRSRSIVKCFRPGRLGVFDKKRAVRYVRWWVLGTGNLANSKHFKVDSLQRQVETLRSTVQSTQERADKEQAELNNVGRLAAVIRNIYYIYILSRSFNILYELLYIIYNSNLLARFCIYASICQSTSILLSHSSCNHLSCAFLRTVHTISVCISHLSPKIYDGSTAQRKKWTQLIKYHRITPNEYAQKLFNHLFNVQNEITYNFVTITSES